MSLFITENADSILDLQLFAGGSGADGGSAGVGTTGGSVPDAAAKSGANAQDAAVQTGEGAVPAANQNVSNNNAPQDRQRAFEEMISGEYKDLFDQSVRNIVKERLKKPTESAKKYEALRPVLDMLGKRYKVDPNDLNALTKAMEDDDAYYEKEALDSGMTVEQVKKMHRLERENAVFKAEAESRLREENAQRLYSTWQKQAEEVRKIYPSFDLAKETQNEDFVALIKNNVDVRTAFEVIHKDEIIPAAMQYTAKAVESKLANKIAANASRPVENGTGGGAASATKKDVRNMTNAELDEYIRRAERGERITFG